MKHSASGLEFFCGRQHELEQVVAAGRAGTKNRTGGVCMVSGPPGIGKTAFCGKLREELPRAGQFPLVLQYRLTGAEDLDNVCASLLSQAAHLRPNDNPLEGLSPFQRAVLSRHLPGLAAAEPSFAFPDIDPRTAAAVWQHCLLEISRREDYGLVVSVDDVHLAAAPLWEFLSGLCRQSLVDDAPLWVWASLRRVDGTEAAFKRAEELLSSLRDEAGYLKTPSYRVSDIRLPALTRAETGQVLDRYFGGGFGASYPEFEQWLRERSAGNPFYLGLLIRACVNHGLVDKDETGSWAYRPGRAGVELGAIDDLIARRVMDTLGEPAFVRPLRVAVALGDAFRFEDWQQMLGLSRSAAIDMLLSLQRRGILSDLMDGSEHRVQFSHPLLLEGFRGVLPRDEQRSGHAAAAAHFQRTSRPVQALDQLVAADATAASLGPAVRSAVPAAFAQNRLTSIIAWTEEIGGLVQGDRAFLLFYALKSASLMGKVNEAVRFHERLEELRGWLSDEQNAAARTAASRALAAVDPKRALAVIEEGLASAGSGGGNGGNIRKELLLHKFYLLEESHQYQQAVDLSRDLLMVDPADDNFAFKIYHTLGMIYLHQGRWDEADRLFRDTVIPRARRRPESDLGRVLESRGAVLARLCRFAEAEQHFARALDIAERNLRIVSVANVLNSRGNVYLRQGKHAMALADKERAARIAFTTGNQVQLASCLNDIAGIKMELGEPSGVIELLQRSLKLKEAMGNRAGCATTMNNIAECFVRGIGAAADHRQALEWALRANALLRELDYNANLVDNLATISQAYLGLRQHGPALDYAGRSLAAAEKQPTPYNRATALAQKGAVLCALGSAEAEPTLRQAAELFHGIGNRHEQANVLLRLADHAYQRGLTNQAREALVAVRDIYLELKRDAALAGLIDRYPDLLGSVPRPAAAGGAAGQAGLRVNVLGQFRAWPVGAAQPLAGRQWGSRLGRRIMAYLLTVDYAARTGVGRDTLLQTFWEKGGGGGSLRVILHRLRGSLNCHDAVTFADNRYSFNWRLSGVWLDREQMEALYRNGLELSADNRWGEAWGLLERAEALFAGEYLEGEDEPWVQKTRKALRATHRALLEKLIELSNRIGRPEAAAFYHDKRKNLSP